MKYIRKIKNKFTILVFIMFNIIFGGSVKAQDTLKIIINNQLKEKLQNVFVINCNDSIIGKMHQINEYAFIFKDTCKTKAVYEIFFDYKKYKIYYELEFFSNKINICDCENPEIRLMKIKKNNLIHIYLNCNGITFYLPGIILPKTKKD